MKTKDTMEKIEVADFVAELKKAFGGKIKYTKPICLINIRGCNGAGKSTVPMQMLEKDEQAFLLTYEGKIRATVYPTYNFIALGKYFSKTGGMDGFKNGEETKAVLEALYEIPMNLIMEGIIASTIFSTYVELFKELEKRDNPKRSIGIMNLLPPMDTIKKRVLKRNGGNDDVKWSQIEGKWRTVERNAQKFKDEGLNSWVADNSGVEFENMIGWFLTQVQENTGVKTAVKAAKNVIPKNEPKKDIKPQEKPAGVSDYAFLSSLQREIKPYWESQYVAEFNEKVKLRVDPVTGKTFWDMYFENMVERQNIWYKRVVLGLHRPWTNDQIMANYHFTNVDRKLDRVTLFYIDNVLDRFKSDYKHMNDKEGVKKFLIFNTFIYRLFVRPETWRKIGYISSFSYETDWERGKEALRKYKADGNTVWTDAYFVNDLKSANPDRANSGDKLENAFHLFQYVLDNIDEIAEFVFNPSNNMESVVNYLTRVPAVGLFTAYEICLDLAMVTEMTGIHFVEWTADYFPNVGPGCKKGIDYVFEDRGGLDYTQIVFFVASVYKSEFERLGLEYKFQEGTTELDLRCLEGWFCESQKWFNAYCSEQGYDWAKGKRPKKKMNLRTDDKEWLKPRK